MKIVDFSSADMSSVPRSCSLLASHLALVKPLWFCPVFSEFYVHNPTDFPSHLCKMFWKLESLHENFKDEDFVLGFE